MGGHSDKVPSIRNGTLLGYRVALTLILDVSVSIIEYNMFLLFE